MVHLYMEDVPHKALSQPTASDMWTTRVKIKTQEHLLNLKSADNDMKFRREDVEHNHVPFMDGDEL